jgi:hypothetical protein
MLFPSNAPRFLLSGVVEHHAPRTHPTHDRLDEDTGVATCTLNEPATLNPLSTCQIWEYNLILKHATRDDRVSVLVWTGHGRAFSAGADLRGTADQLALHPTAIECELLPCSTLPPHSVAFLPIYRHHLPIALSVLRH